MSNALTISELLSKGVRLLKERAIPNPRTDAELLLAHVLTRSKLYIITNPDEIIDSGMIEEYLKAISMRAYGNPVQYIIGAAEFYNVSLKVNPDVLIPRPETEVLVSSILEVIREDEFFEHEEKLSLLEIGTGSGAISVAIAYELCRDKDLRIVATDVSNRALKVAEENIKNYGLGELIELRLGDMFEVIDEGEMFHIIISNPPYVRRKDLETLPEEVREREPMVALVSGETGFELIDILLGEGRKHLHRGGILALEMGMGQRDRVAAMFEKNGYQHYLFRNDLTGIPRVAMAWWGH
ncbi:MAG: peptide chain release factor N(5)-glutamine methyltransferase [Candidatus Glassbacteria bacterium]